MSMMQGWTVIGIFEEQDQARQAIDELHAAGFSDDQVGFVFRDGVPTVNKVDVDAEENASAFTGGIMGGGDSSWASATGATGPRPAAATTERRNHLIELPSREIARCGPTGIVRWNRPCGPVVSIVPRRNG